MSVLFRTARVFSTALLRPPLALDGVSELTFRVWPSDLDLNLHMNNGRYLTLMDLGRFDLIARGGFVKPVLKNRWQPLVGNAHIRFRRSLAPFQKYTLKSRLLCWDAKWLFIEQTFHSSSEEIASAWIKGLFRGKEGNVPTAQLLEAGGYPGAVSPPMPETLRSEANPS